MGAWKGGQDPRTAQLASAQARKENARKRKEEEDKARKGLSMTLGESESVMRAILHDPESLDTSKVAAARALQSLHESRASHSPEAEVWMARQRTIEALPQGDRLAFLRECVGLEG